jgi:hypothetical protein
MSSSTLHADLILIRRHYANFRKDVMGDEALRYLTGLMPRAVAVESRKRLEADRAELDALCRCIKRLESERWKRGKK